ncbi:MAG: right-handed parallel beta-helix repeat-containing protein [Victivallaceae bacterium]|nr:right-handed parallel beta-helix repeat-containing protein [Victivallaceae bacterium]
MKRLLLVLAGIFFAAGFEADADFVRYASSYATSGSGTTADPYIGGIQEAHDSLPNEGGIIIVDGHFQGQGTYITLSKDNLEVAGKHGFLHGLAFTGATGIKNVTIRDLTIGDETTALSLYGILFNDCENITIRNVNVIRTNYGGIKIGNGDKLKVINCNVKDINGSGANGIYFYQSTNGEIAGCTVDTVSNDGITCYTTCENITVRDCTSRNAADDAITLNGDGGTSYRLFAFGNRCYNAVRGLNISNASDSKVENNYVEGCSGPGIRVQRSNRTIVRSNTVTESGTGILIFSYENYLIVDGNLAYNNDQAGIYIWYAIAKSQITNNMAYNNSQESSGTYSGIKASYVQDCIIASNASYGEDQLYGIEIVDIDASKLTTNCLIIGNKTDNFYYSTISQTNQLYHNWGY